MPERFGWYGLVAFYRDAAAQDRQWKATRPLACPNDGEPLQVGPDGVRFCHFDGYRDVHGDHP